MVNNFNNKYSQSTLSKFDIIGSYFVNLYYNEFYIKAKNLKTQGAYNNMTDAYKNILSSYVDFSTHQDFFKQIVKGIHTYCISTTRHTTMSHKECIDFMVSEFVPNNLWNSLRENQKNKLFHESLINCIKVFTENIITNHLHIIIDNHDQNENIIILQDLFLTVILLEKDKIFSKFINPGDNSGLELFKQKLQKIIDDKKKLIDSNKNLTDKINLLDSLNKKNSNIILELQKNNKLLINEINKLKQSNNDYKQNEKILLKRIHQYTNIIKEYNEIKIRNQQIQTKKTKHNEIQNKKCEYNKIQNNMNNDNNNNINNNIENNVNNFVITNDRNRYKNKNSNNLNKNSPNDTIIKKNIINNNLEIDYNIESDNSDEFNHLENIKDDYLESINSDNLDTNDDNLNTNNNNLDFNNDNLDTNDNNIINDDTDNNSIYNEDTDDDEINMNSKKNTQIVKNLIFEEDDSSYY